MGYLILGFVLFIIGLILSFTGIGACLGLPLIVLGLVFQIVGGVKLRQAAMEELKRSIRDGIVEGAREAKGEEVTCPACGTKMPTNAKFCPSCGRPNVPQT